MFILLYCYSTSRRRWSFFIYKKNELAFVSKEDAVYWSVT